MLILLYNQESEENKKKIKKKYVKISGSQLEEIREAFAMKKSEIDNLKRENVSLESHVKLKCEEVKFLEKYCNTISVEYEEKYANLEAKYEALKSELSKLESDRINS